MFENGPIIDREGDRIQSTATAKDLVQAVTALNLSSLPPENRLAAVMERLGTVMLATTTDPRERDKPAFRQAEAAYTLKTGVILPQ